MQLPSEELHFPESLAAMCGHVTSFTNRTCEKVICVTSGLRLLRSKCGLPAHILLSGCRQWWGPQRFLAWGPQTSNKVADRIQGSGNLDGKEMTSLFSLTSGTSPFLPLGIEGAKYSNSISQSLSSQQISQPLSCHTTAAMPRNTTYAHLLSNYSIYENYHQILFLTCY